MVLEKLLLVRLFFFNTTRGLEFCHISLSPNRNFTRMLHGVDIRKFNIGDCMLEKNDNPTIHSQMKVYISLNGFPGSGLC